MGHWGAKTPWFRLPRHLVFKTSRTSRLQADWSVSKKVAGWIWNCCHVSAWSHWAGELWWNVILFIIVYCLSSEDGFICFVVSFNCDVRKATWKSVGSFGYCVSSPQITPIGGRLSSSASQPSRHPPGETAAAFMPMSWASLQIPNHM